MSSKVKHISFEQKVKWLRNFFCEKTFIIFNTINNTYETVVCTKLDSIVNTEKDYVAIYDSNNNPYSFWHIHVDVDTFNMIMSIDNNRFKVKFAGRHSNLRLYITDIGESCMNEL